MLLSELQTKDIIEVENGEKIGFISDLELDVTVGVILSLVVSVKGKWFGVFGEQEEIAISWSQIEKIGADVILVRMIKHSP
ncbi:YlmC/YmxH family sporulation protein [Alkalibacillus haloalkaliphilus]|uniref:YlmC/YmxH family sporulation protein n=1 Tax=Alkalibacillus haloalkaliphilus TaxID=94136 RepID=UPI000305926E|nr:YlmC/YmxH family sporulation protein [Alkalibacillus haloalkaliphilus]